MHVCFFAFRTGRLPYFWRLCKALEERGHTCSFIAHDRYADIWLRWHNTVPLSLPKLFHQAKKASSQPICPLTEDELNSVCRFTILRHEVNGHLSPEAIREIAKTYCTVFCQLWGDIKPDAIVLHNGWGLSREVAACLARKRGCRTIFHESACFPGTNVFDEVGVNFKGSFPAMPLTQQVDYERLRAFIADYHRGKRPTGRRAPGRMEMYVEITRRLESLFTLGWRRLPDELPYGFKENWYAFQKRTGLRLSFLQGEPDLAPLPKPYVLLPLEIHDGYSALMYSPLVRDIETLVRECLTVLPPGHTLVVKEHPTDRGRYSTVSIKRVLQEAGGIFLTGGSMPKLLQEAASVVTICSTVGLEALTYYKPVVVLGEAIFGGRGATFDVDSLDQLPGKLAEAVAGQVDHQQVDRLLYTLIFDYLYHSDWHYPEYGSVDPVADLLVKGT